MVFSSGNIPADVKMWALARYERIYSYSTKSWRATFLQASNITLFSNSCIFRLRSITYNVVKRFAIARKY